MSSGINVLFDLDFQKLISKIWKQKPGILIVVDLFADTRRTKFFCRFNKPNTRKIWKTYEIGIVWSKYLKRSRSNLISYLKILATFYNGQKLFHLIINKKMGPMRFELMTFRLSVERSSQAELRAHDQII